MFKPISFFDCNRLKKGLSHFSFQYFQIGQGILVDFGPPLVSYQLTFPLTFTALSFTTSEQQEGIWHWHQRSCKYRQVSNIRRTFVDNKIVDHSDVVGASPVGAAPTTSHSRLNAWLH